jgi:hypothetical protein
MPGEGGIEKEIEDAKALATERCVAAGGNRRTIEIVEIDIVPVSYTTNGATRLLLRVVGDLVEGYEESHNTPESMLDGDVFQKSDLYPALPNGIPQDPEVVSKGSSYDIIEHVDIETYRPRIEGDLWYLSEVDLQFLQDGTGVLGVGSCGEPYPSYLACSQALREGKDITIRRQDTFPDDAVLLVGGFMVSFRYPRRSHDANKPCRALQLFTKSAYQVLPSN